MIYSLVLITSLESKDDEDIDELGLEIFSFWIDWLEAIDSIGDGVRLMWPFWLQGEMDPCFLCWGGFDSSGNAGET